MFQFREQPRDAILRGGGVTEGRRAAVATLMRAKYQMNDSTLRVKLRRSKWETGGRQQPRPSEVYSRCLLPRVRIAALEFISDDAPRGRSTYTRTCCIAVRLGSLL